MTWILCLLVLAVPCFSPTTFNHIIKFHTMQKVGVAVLKMQTSYRTGAYGKMCAALKAEQMQPLAFVVLISGRQGCTFAFQPFIPLVLFHSECYYPPLDTPRPGDWMLTTALCFIVVKFCMNCFARAASAWMVYWGGGRYSPPFARIWPSLGTFEHCLRCGNKASDFPPNFLTVNLTKWTPVISPTIPL